jgi:hypothetical protein
MPIVKDDLPIADARRVPTETNRALEEAIVWKQSLPLSPRQSTSSVTMSSSGGGGRGSTKATLNATTHIQRVTAELIVWPGWKMGEEGRKEDATFNTSNRESGLAYQLNTLSVKAVQVAETMIACEVVADSIVAKATATFNRWKRRDIIPISAQYVATRGGGHTAGIT